VSDVASATKDKAKDAADYVSESLSLWPEGGLDLDEDEIRIMR